MILDRSTPPAIHDAIEFDFNLPPLNITKLDNGTPLYWVAAGVQDVVQIDWVFPAGIWYEEKASVAHATAGIMKEGTKNHTSKQINESLEFYGAQLSVSAGNDNSTISLHTLTRHLPVLLPMVLEILTEANFPEHEVEIHKRNAIQRLLVNLRKGEFVAFQKIDALVFGETHPYGRFTKLADIEAITGEDLLNHYKKHFKLDNAKIFMGGKVSEKEVKLVNDIFGKQTIEPAAAETKKFELPAVQEKSHRIINDPNAVQGAIRIARLFPNRQHPDFTPMYVLNTLFGGYFGSRLMSNIREEKGFTYGIHSSLIPRVHEGSMLIQTETGRDVTELAIKEVYKEMERLCNEPADEEELLLVKNYVLGSILGDLDGPFSILQRWRTLILNGFNEEQFNNNIRIYKTITPQELQVLAQKYYDPAAFYEVVVI